MNYNRDDNLGYNGDVDDSILTPYTY